MGIPSVLYIQSIVLVAASLIPGQLIPTLPTLQGLEWNGLWIPFGLSKRRSTTRTAEDRCPDRVRHFMQQNTPTRSTMTNDQK